MKDGVSRAILLVASFFCNWLVTETLRFGKEILSSKFSLVVNVTLGRLVRRIEKLIIGGNCLVIELN